MVQEGSSTYTQEVDISLTASAANVVASLAPAAKSAIGKFLGQELPKFVETHEAVEIGALDGKYWVVRPGDDPGQPTFLVTMRPRDDGTNEELVVVSAVVPGEAMMDADPSPPDPTDIAVGVEVFGSVKPASDGS